MLIKHSSLCGLWIWVIFVKLETPSLVLFIRIIELDKTLVSSGLAIGLAPLRFGTQQAGLLRWLLTNRHRRSDRAWNTSMYEAM